jgi:GNAT superfamily N-acetyltransferase
VAVIEYCGVIEDYRRIGIGKLMYEKILEDILSTAQQYGVIGINFAISNNNDIMIHVMIPKFNAVGYAGRVDDRDPNNFIMMKSL